MPTLRFTDEQLHAKAIELGLVGEGERLPASLRARVAAVLRDEQARAVRANAERYAQEASRGAAVADLRVVGDALVVDGRPIRGVVADGPIEYVPGRVRLTLTAARIAITPAAGALDDPDDPTTLLDPDDPGDGGSKQEPD